MRLAKELDSKLFKEFARNYYHATLPKDLIKTIVLFYENGGCMKYEQMVKNKDLLERVRSLQKMGILFSIPYVIHSHLHLGVERQLVVHWLRLKLENGWK